MGFTPGQQFGIYLGARTVQVPLNSGWTETKVETGDITKDATSAILVTGTTALSSAMMTIPLRFFGQGGDVSEAQINWDLPVSIVFDICHKGDDVEFVTYIQLKSENTRGALAAMGLGIRITETLVEAVLEHRVYGQVYAEALHTTTGYSVTSASYIYRVQIESIPGIGVSFYVNGDLLETLEYTPSGVATAYLAASVENGATGTVEDKCYISPITISQSM